MSTKPLENQTKTEKNNSKINKGKLIGVIACLLILALSAGFLTYAGNYSKVYPNTYIDGSLVSGLTKEELQEKCSTISQEYSLPENIEFTIKGETLSVPVSELKLSFDAKKTASDLFKNREKMKFGERAYSYIKSLFGRNDIDISADYDKEKLNGLISEFAEPYEEDPVNASYEAENGKLTIKKGHHGIKVDKKAMEDDISRYIKNPKNEIALTLSNTKSKSFEFEALYKELSAPAKDASYERNDDGEVIIIPDKPKVVVDKNKLKEALNSTKPTVSLPAKITPAKVTKNALEEALFSGTMGSWTSYFTASNYSRSANVALAASRIDGTILLPGETFSYDKAVGPRTAQNGFKMAGVYINNKVEEGIGGGVCQTSSTLYSAVLYANLEIVERVSHSLPVSYMPPGQDATIAEGAIDFRFKNNTDHPIKISATISGGSVTCKIIGTPVTGQKVVINTATTAVYQPGIEIETDDSIPIGYKETVVGSKGSAVSSSRTVYQDGKAISTQALTKSVYHATPTVVTVNPADKNTPIENLIEYSEEAFATPPDVTEQNGEIPSEPEAKPDDSEIIEI